MDLKARTRWVDYSRARDALQVHTSSPHAPWYLGNAKVKRHARLNVISHLIGLIPCEDLTPDHLQLPERQKAGDYQHPDISQFKIVPARYP
jgi:hypothetical protein